MRKLTFADLSAPGPDGPALPVPGCRVERGGFRRYDQPGHRTHDEPGPHRHAGVEVFCVFQGSGVLEINGAPATGFGAGDVLVIEPGEDHHLISRDSVPLVFTWMHLSAS